MGRLNDFAARNPAHEITVHDPTQYLRIPAFTVAELNLSASL